MFDTYRAVFRVPGTAAFCAAAFVMRLPLAIYGLALVLIVSARNGEYGFAGVLSACYVFGSAPGTPLLGRLVDRYGQRRVIAPATVVHAAAVVSTAVLLETHLPQWTATLPAFVSGFTYVAAGSVVRARWSYVLAGTSMLTTAYSLESALDEIIFVIGPLIATIIATNAAPVLTLYVGMTLVVAGAAWLWTQRATEPPAADHDAPPHPSALRSRGMLLLTLVGVGMGAIFSSGEVTMVAFCGQHGHRGASGIVLASFACGSAIAGFAYGARTWSADLLRRFLVQVCIFAVIPAVFLTAVNVPMLAACAFVVGVTVAPTLITAFGLIEQIIPAGALTEGISWLLTGLSLGYGLGSALVGGIADAHGARLAFLVTVAAGLSMGAAGIALYRRLRQAPETTMTASESAVVG